MPLTPPVLPSEVEAIGALTPALFDLPDQTSLDTFVQGAIDFSDSWLQAHLGSSYGLAQFPWQVNLQRRGAIYLALEALVDTAKAKKIFGTHYAYISEESPNYEALIENEWGQRALIALDTWLTVERVGHGFALPLFLTSAPIPEIEQEGNDLSSLSALYSELLDRARGISLPDVGTVRR